VCALQPKIAKINKKNLFLEVQRPSKSSMLIRLKSSLLVLVVIGSMPMSISNRFHERLTFTGYRSLMPLNAGFLERRKSRLRQSKSTFNAENSYASSPCLSQLILVQFSLEMCLAARIRQKIHKNGYFGIHRHPRSLNLVSIESQCMTSG